MAETNQHEIKVTVAKMYLAKLSEELKSFGRPKSVKMIQKILKLKNRTEKKKKKNRTENRKCTLAKTKISNISISIYIYEEKY